MNAPGRSAATPRDGRCASMPIAMRLGVGVRRMCEASLGRGVTAKEVLELGDVERPREVVALPPSTAELDQFGNLIDALDTFRHGSQT